MFPALLDHEMLSILTIALLTGRCVLLVRDEEFVLSCVRTHGVFVLNDDCQCGRQTCVAARASLALAWLGGSVARYLSGWRVMM